MCQCRAQAVVLYMRGAVCEWSWVYGCVHMHAVYVCVGCQCGDRKDTWQHAVHGYGALWVGDWVGAWATVIVVHV